MNPALRRYLDAATGLTALTAQKAERIVKGLVKSGEAAGDQVGDLVNDLLTRSKKNRESLTALVRSETSRAVHGAGLATSVEVQRLQKQVADLKREVTRLERAAGVTPTGKKSAKKSAKKTAKKSAKRTAKKAGAKRTAKRTAKKTAKKATGRST